MTPHPSPGPPRPTTDPAAGLQDAPADVVVEATRRLRGHADRRWVEIADQVVTAALTATRRSLPLRAMAPGGPVQVSEQVVVAKLRARLDASLSDAAVTDISFTVQDRDLATGVVVQLVARYGVPLIPVADEAREVTGEVLAELLGPVSMSVDVQAMHVHFADVTTEDPHG